MTPGTNGASAPQVVSTTSVGERRMWLSDMAIRQPVFITMAVLAVMVVGLLAYSRMGLSLWPDVSLPTVAIQTSYPGADPAEVERSVSKPLEDAVASINGVEKVSSTSMEGFSLVVTQFNMSGDPKLAEDEVRARVGAIRNTLPSGVREPVIQKYDVTAMPVMSFAVADTTGARDQTAMRELVDDVVKPRLERVQGVANVDVTGGLKREVHVDLRLAQLESAGLAPAQVVQAIQRESLDVPGGRIVTGTSEESVRTSGEARTIAELATLPVVTRPGGSVIRLGDVADVYAGHEEVRGLSRLDGQESVVASVRKQSGTNTVQVADAVKREIGQLEQEYPDLRFAVALDQSTFTRVAVEEAQTSLWLGAILAALVVLIFFRDIRNTLVTVVGLPVILFGTFGVMQLLGITLNMVSLMALSLTVGMLIDDAIVVRENIFRHMERGEEPRTAAGRGTAEIALAVVAVSSTIVAVFLPIAFTGGIAGRYLRDFGIPVAVAVLISLVEAFTLAPMLSAHFFRRIDAGRAKDGRVSLFARVFGRTNGGYRRLLGWSLRHRLAVVGVGTLALLASLATVPFLTFAMMPASDQGIFSVKLEMPASARLADTDQQARIAEATLAGLPEVAHVFTTVGSDDGAVDNATIVVRTRGIGQTFDLMDEARPVLRQALGETKHVVVDPDTTMNTMSTGSAFGSLVGLPIQFSVLGADVETLDRVSADFAARLAQVEGAVDVNRSVKQAKPGRTITADRARAADLGVSVAEIGTTARMLVNGERAGGIASGDRRVDVVVRLAEPDRDDPGDLLRLPVMTSRGDQVPLGRVARVTESSDPNRIERENRQRQVTVAAGYLGDDMGAVLSRAKSVADSMELPPGVTIKVSGQSENDDEMFTSLLLALGLSIMFVYMILASQFGSFVHPFTIMLALPLSLVGALVALFATGFNFDMLAMIGLMLLMGLVTKNSILLVEFINQLRRAGLSTRDAILEAGPTRLRPIVMTTLAMIFGMLPAALGTGAGSEMRQPMGVSVIGGLITSTLLTLVVVPVVYSLLDDLGRWVRRERHGASLAETAVVAPAEPAELASVAK